MRSSPGSKVRQADDRSAWNWSGEKDEKRRIFMREIIRILLSIDFGVNPAALEQRKAVI